ncbi:hypothetical protein SUGI_0824420 [Cryptomeria japonica]|nr:hypothetical protein SUGI_0824420 [Cryptomeria japonica]
MGSDSIQVKLRPVAPIAQTGAFGYQDKLNEKDLECSQRFDSNIFCSNSDSPTDSISSSSNSEAVDGDNGEPISVDDVHFKKQLHPPAMVRKKSYEIKVRNLSYGIVIDKPSFYMFHPCRSERPVHQILKNISCDAKPGEILAIVGPSGAGKSTLLEILAGRIRLSRKKGDPLDRRIMVNDKPVNPSWFRRISGYVTQEDALLPLLTVKETLMFSARFRLPPSLSKEEKEAKVESLLSELGLVHVSNTRIGDESIRGVSGGERRRVSIGVDVIHDPAVLLLDEPTSGLDSAAALNVVEMLHAMAKNSHNRTIILTIHQPSYRILSLISSLLLLSKGSVAHHGSLESLQNSLISGGRKIPAQLNALEYAMEMISEGIMLAQDYDHDGVGFDKPANTAEDGVLMALDIESVLCIEDPFLGTSPQDDTLYVVDDDCAGDTVSYANSRCSEICTLSSRFCKIIYRTQQLFLARTLQAVVAGLGLGSVYLKERQILMRETSRGAYRVSSYVISNTLVFLPFLLIVAILFAVPVYWLGTLSYSPYWELSFSSRDISYPKITSPSQDILKQRGLQEGRKWMNVEIMVGFFIFYRILCYVILKRRASKAKR